MPSALRQLSFLPLLPWSRVIALNTPKLDSSNIFLPISRLPSFHQAHKSNLDKDDFVQEYSAGLLYQCVSFSSLAMSKGNRGQSLDTTAVSLHLKKRIYDEITSESNVVSLIYLRIDNWIHFSAVLCFRWASDCSPPLPTDSTELLIFAGLPTSLNIVSNFCYARSFPWYHEKCRILFWFTNILIIIFK